MHAPKAMRWSKALLPTLKEAPKEATAPSHALLLRAGCIRMVGAGLYEFLPFGLRALQRVANIIRDEMNQAGAQELLMPALLPSEPYRETGRWDSFGDILLRLRDRKGGDYLLGPTHEEIITDLARREIRSYRQLPLNLYQIQTKFRDEPRPRAGLLRCREFLMKDAYSFDASEAAALHTYGTMREAYQRIFRRLGLRYRMVAASSGDMGGSTSAEFQVLAQEGEDDIVACDACDHAANVEVANGKAGEPCPQCGAPLVAYRAIEGGHIFVLGTHYSEKMQARFTDEHGQSQPLVMGCYGIGVSRLVAACVEQHHDEQGILWPMSVAPYQVLISLLGSDDATVAAAAALEEQLRQEGIDVLVDDRDERPGVKFKDADLLGIPLRAHVGGRALQRGVIELKRRGTPDTLELPPAEAAPWLGAAVRQALSDLGS